MTDLKWIGVATTFVGTITTLATGAAWAGLLVPVGAVLFLFAQRQDRR